MSVNSKLVIVVAMSAKPDPENPNQAFIDLAVSPQWIVGKIPQRCTDRALVIATLKRALDSVMAEVPFDPPSVIAAPPMELVRGAH